MSASTDALTERVRLIGLSLATSARKRDHKAVAKWATRLADAASSLAVALEPPTPVEEADVTPIVRAVPLTYDQEHEIFLDAEDELLKAAGRPYGRGGEERGALPLFTHIELAEKLNLPLHVAEFKSFIVVDAKQ